MRYTTLRNSDLSVSRICLGCMGFGDAKNGQHSWTLDEAHSREIIRRVAELADKRDVTMMEISLAWLLTKVTAPAVGATKLHHIDGAARAVEEPYVPYALVGVMAQNTAFAAKEPHVWSTGDQKIK